MANIQNLTLNDSDYIRFRELILARSGLHFPEHKRADLAIGLSKALVESSLVSSKPNYDLGQYYNLISDTLSPLGQHELGRLINLLTIGETYFFRDEAQFDALYTHILPSLIERKRTEAAAIGSNTPPQLRLWSAGCASGEEPYSLAILLKELIPDLERWRILILGTDINHDILKRAAEARYSDWSFRENRAKLFKAKYFTTEANGRFYQLNEAICRMVTFNYLNLTEATYPNYYNNTANMDLIVCRNVTIYFTQEITQQIIHRFYEALALNNWLMVGHAESSLSTYRAFQARNFPNTVLYQKTGQPTFWPEIWHGSAPTNSKPAYLTTLEPTKFTFEPATQFASPPPSPPKPVSVQVDTYELARTLIETGQSDQAVQQLQIKLATEPKFAPAYAMLGRAYADLGRWKEAKQACEQAISLNKLSTEAYLILALIYQNENKLDLAITNLKTATYLDHKAPLPFFNLAMVYQKNGQIELAKRTFEVTIRLLEKWPTDKPVPETGGKSAVYLLQVSRQILNGLKK